MKKKTLNITVASQEQRLYSGEACRVLVPGIQGRFEIRYNHCPIMSLLKSGSVIIHRLENRPLAICIDAGIIQVEDNVVSILTDSAHQARLEEQQRLKEKQKALRQQIQNHKGTDYDALLKNLEQLTSEINAIEEIRKN